MISHMKGWLWNYDFMKFPTQLFEDLFFVDTRGWKKNELISQELRTKNHQKMPGTRKRSQVRRVGWKQQFPSVSPCFSNFTIQLLHLGLQLRPRWQKVRVSWDVDFQLHPQKAILKGNVTYTSSNFFLRSETGSIWYFMMFYNLGLCNNRCNLYILRTKPKLVPKDLLYRYTTFWFYCFRVWHWFLFVQSPGASHQGTEHVEMKAYQAPVPQMDDCHNIHFGSLQPTFEEVVLADKNEFS